MLAHGVNGAIGLIHLLLSNSHFLFYIPPNTFVGFYVVIYYFPAHCSPTFIITRGRSFGEFVEIEFEETRADAVDLDTTGEIAAEGAAVVVAEGFDAVTDDVPAEDFLIDVAEEDAGGELGEVGVLLHEGLGIERDGLLEVFKRDVGVQGAAELHLDLVAGEAEVEAEDGEVDALFEILSVPEEGGAVCGFDDDESLLLLAVLLIEDGGFLLFALAHFGAEGAVLDVAAGDFEEALLHELFFDKVLDVFDVNELFVFGNDGAADGLGDLDGGGGIKFEGEEGLAHGDLDLVVVPGDELAA